MRTNVARDYDRRADFESPDARGRGRTAAHRYVPAERRAAKGEAKAGRALVEEHFTELNFSARWWPAPDGWK